MPQKQFYADLPRYDSNDWPHELVSLGSWPTRAEAIAELKALFGPLVDDEGRLRLLSEVEEEADEPTGEAEQVEPAPTSEEAPQ